MKAKIEIEIKPFSAPNVVLLKIPMGNGDDTVSSIPLKEIDPGTLDKLCDDFTNEIFKKAGKSRPVQNADNDEDNSDQDEPPDPAMFPSQPHSKAE